MMIEHAALFVRDLEAAKAFFETYFGAVSNALYQNPKEGFCSYFLTFDGGARLEIMTKTGIADADRQNEQTGYSHIAFSLGSNEAVNRLTERLRADGYAVVSGPRTTGDGYYESAVLDGEGNRIELTV
ncbi:MAG: VOC family protein [Oscillospiraceae bacterium]|nr:VOC family protein [Oscillospiraceae bacterium]